ncbi:MAG: aromatic ring-hydroxylating dioxygenase subunit alpha [Anaerolineaceae bacterium]|nr:aromatic ring-hydroxylating dioxygenase subunit alpha [Anaerolineaceae bacterium]
MIRNQWYVILDSKEVKPGKPVGVTRLGEKLAIWRDSEGNLSCFGDQCPHMHASLSEGKINGDLLVCPFHGFQYDDSGQCAYLPAIGKNGTPPKFLKAKVYPTFESNGFIWIYWGEPSNDLKPPKFFDALMNEKFQYTSFKDHWNTHYSRMLENQLDVCHLPFVHHNTIGRGQNVVIEGPYVEVENDLINVWVMNRKDDGTPVKPIPQISKPERNPSLQFRYPNIWHNWIADDIRVMIAFVPVDAENTILYGRFYQRVLRVPLLRGIFGILGNLSSLIIAGQDKRVVTKIVPKDPEQTDQEQLRVSDSAIIAYRKHKKRLIEKSRVNK